MGSGLVGRHCYTPCQLRQLRQLRYLLRYSALYSASYCLTVLSRNPLLIVYRSPISYSLLRISNTLYLPFSDYVLNNKLTYYKYVAGTRKFLSSDISFTSVYLYSALNLFLSALLRLSDSDLRPRS